MVLLHSSDENGITFVRTDQLDGETDWKVRIAVKFAQKNYNKNPEQFMNSSWKILAEPPTDQIYEFNGLFINQFSEKEGLNISHMLLSNMTVASGEVLGFVVYVGRETRMELNNQEIEIKIGKTDREINLLTKYLFLILFILSFILLLSSGKILQADGFLFFMRVFIIMSSIIPISLKVNVDFAKLYYSLVINRDKNIKGAIARNSNIPEELGRIEYLLSDKTGTLTQNEMKLKKFRSLYKSFDEDEFEEIKKSLKNFK
jgi:phospholipid-translocating ATPase